MKNQHLHICLFKPEIPQNTGNIARLAAATQCRLHLIQPFGFKADDKNLLRPGLDYWPYLDLEIHSDFEAFKSLFDSKRVAFLSARSSVSYTQIPLSVDVLVFGQETAGLPANIHSTYKQQMYNIPIFHKNVRSLNIANATSIVVYQQLLKKSLVSSLKAQEVKDGSFSGPISQKPVAF